MEMCDADVKFHLPGGDILIMAGDTLTAAHLDENRRDAGGRTLRKRFEKFAREEISKYQEVIEIAGNHTFYNCSIERAFKLERAFWCEHAPHVRFLENEYAMIGGICFACTTLWATCGAGRPMNELRIGSIMNDFRLIYTERQHPLGDKPNGRSPRRFTVHDANFMHQEAVAFLELTLEWTKLNHIPVIVVTHHAPSFRSKIEGGRSWDNGVDEAYYSHQDALIRDNPHIRYWIHGHTHDSCRYKIGETWIISNQRGYVGDRSAKIFDINAADFELEDVLKIPWQ